MATMVDNSPPLLAPNAKAWCLALGVATLIASSTITPVLFDALRHSGNESATSIAAVSDMRRLPFTPRGGAFIIWTPIFASLIGVSVYAFVHALRDDDGTSMETLLPSASVIAITAAEALAAAWTPLFIANTPLTLSLASASLVSAAACAFASLLFLGAPQWSKWNGVSPLFTHGAFALFCGWLCVAAILGVAIAVSAAEGEQDAERGAPASVNNNTLTDAQESTSHGSSARIDRASEAVRGTVALIACSLALFSRNAVVPLPAMWALLWQPLPLSTASIVGAIASGALSLLLFVDRQ